MPEHHRQRLQRVLAYIENNLDQPLPLANLAAIACFSRYHFSRWFTHHVGRGPQRYVHERRLWYAQTLLRSTNRRIGEIALATGWTDQSHLTSTFRRELGVTPADYRQTRKTSQGAVVVPIHHGRKAATIRANIPRNISTERRSGRPIKQAVAIGLSIARADAKKAHINPKSVGLKRRRSS